MASSWTDLATQMTDLYTTNLQNTMQRFRERHGPNGDGNNPNNPNAIPYRFGRFAERLKKQGLPNTDDLLTDRQKAQFLIDAGARRWDATSVADIEQVVKHSMTRNDANQKPAPKQIGFEVVGDPSASVAKAQIFPGTGIHQCLASLMERSTLIT